MGASGSKMARQIKALRNFKKYEDIFNTYLNKKAFNSNDLDFYLVPKDYINTFCNSFNYRNNISDLKDLNIYHDCNEKSVENEIIEKDLITCLEKKNKNIIDSNLMLQKINNNSIINQENNGEYSFKLNKEGLFIPLTFNIWDKFYRYYGCDIPLKRKGFTNKGELYILTEKKRLDCFFKDIKTKDVIYHFCIKMNDKNKFDNLKEYFKDHSIQDLLVQLDIKYVGNKYKEERFKEIKKKLPSNLRNIGGEEISIYHLDSYIFKENREFEKIEFIVEKGLQKPNNYYQMQDKDKILNKLFSIENPKKILMSNFDNDVTQFFNSNKKSLIQGLILAYKNHYPIVISPDIIWILFLQGFSRFMDKYSEKVRNKFVTFTGKKIINVKKIGIFPKDASKETWQEVIDNFVGGIKSYVGEEMISNLQSDFTTTEEVTLATSQATIMSSMKNFFEFDLAMGGCGISSIILEGTLEDWEKIKSKLNYLSQNDFGLNWWIKHLIQIIDKIIMTKNYYKQNKNINNELKKFWKNIIRIKDEKNDFYDPYTINGWIINFIPNLSEDNPKIFSEMKKDDIPDQIISCPLKLTVYNLNSTKTIHECDLVSGFFGMTQNKKNFSVRPIIGYALISNERQTFPMTKEEIKEIY